MDFVEQPSIGMMRLARGTFEHFSKKLIAAKIGRELKKGGLVMAENEEVQAPAIDPDPEARITNLEARVLELERAVDDLQQGLAYRRPIETDLEVETAAPGKVEPLTS